MRARTCRFLFLFLGAVLARPAVAQTMLWSNSWSNWTTIQSSVWTSPAQNLEAADDFNVQGRIERILVGGDNPCIAGCAAPPVTGVWVRFYAWTPSGPGALQRELFLSGSDPNFRYDAAGPDVLDITLPTPFDATGQHFLSVQPVFTAAFAWSIWVADHGAAVGSHLWVKDNLAGSGWQQASDYLGPLDDDLYFMLYGTPAGGSPPEVVADCGTWSVIDSPNPNGPARLTDVHVVSPWDIWAVGWFDGPLGGDPDDHWQSLTLHWNGSAWSIVPSPSPGPNPSSTQVALSAVSAVNGSNVWAVGGKRAQDAGGYNGTRVFALRWDGQTWQDMNAPWPPNRDGSVYTSASGEQFNDVVALPTGPVWAVGRWWHEFPGGQITWPGVAMRWNGGGFDVFEFPMVSPQGRQWANAVAAVSADDIWAVGEGDGTNEPAYIWHWNGTAWAHVPGPTPGADRALNSVLVFAADDVWVGGWSRDALYNYSPLILHWNGTAWTQVATPAGGDQLAGWAPDQILTYGTNGWAHWDGSSWTSQPGLDGLSAIGPAVGGLAVVSPCELWAVGLQWVAGDAATLTAKLQPSGTPGDADSDGVTDAADNCPTVYNPGQADCDGDGAGDACELTTGTAHDCNGNLQPDECESFDDCDANGVPDECEPDCNANDVADACDIAGATSLDCDANGVPDECDVVADCNGNGVSDACDIGTQLSDDGNGNGYPDECEALGPGFATVNTTQDVVDFGGAQRLDDLPGPDGRISFREAVLAVNHTPGPQTIAFNIPPDDWGIDPHQALLALEQGAFFVTDDDTTLDFTTQTAFTGDTNPNGGEVAIYGYEPNAWGIAALFLQADRCTVKGLDRVLQRGYAVQISGNDNRVIGSTISGPWFAAVYITGGWEGPVASGNVISGNRLSAGDSGVRIDGPAANNVVVGNTLSGGWSGVSIRGGASGNRVGGPTTAERNVVSGAGHYGEEGCPTGAQISIENSPGNLVEGNYIGLTADGSASAGQAGTVGVEVFGSSGTIVRDNAIGGILVVGVNHCNNIRYGTAVAVWGGSSNTLIRNNLIGTDVTGTNPVVNHSGIAVASAIQSGSPTSTRIEGNRIAFAETVGVGVGPDVAGVTISNNSISDNGGLGITLSVTGNGGQPAPSVTSATSDDLSAAVAGSLAASPGASYLVELFASPSCDPSGFGEGRRALGSALVTTNASGAASFSFVAPAVVAAGEVVTATATATATGNTSQFSACRVVESVPCSAAPGEVPGVTVDPDQRTVEWTPYGSSVVYDVARGDMGGLRAGGGASCIASRLTSPFVTDPALPGVGRAFYYLVRASNACGSGPWQGATQEATISCP